MTYSDHRRTQTLHFGANILLRSYTMTAQRRVKSKLKFECRTIQGAVGNFGFDRK